MFLNTKQISRNKPIQTEARHQIIIFNRFKDSIMIKTNTTVNPPDK